MGSTGFPARVDRLESLSHPIRFSYFMALDEFLEIPLTETGKTPVRKLQMTNPVAERELTAVQEIISHLHQCDSRPSLRDLFANRILPVLNAHSAVYAWIDPDLLSPMLIDCINIPEKEIPSIKRFIESDPRAGLLLTHSYPVIARDIDFPGADDSLRVDPFAKGHNQTEKGYGYFSTAQSDVITLALRDSNLAAGIHRRLPCDKTWTVRDVHLMEQIRPHLLMTIKTIVLTEELARQKSLVEILADSPTAIAVIDRDMQISYHNPAWRKLFPTQTGPCLSQDLSSLLMQEKVKFQPPFAMDAVPGREVLYQLSHTDYRLSFSPLKRKKPEEGDPWLLQVKPAVDSRIRLELLQREAGLTRREVEACDLLRQGKDASEIADRLFISPHTVKTHLKKIHQKLGVHTRAQLVAALNSY